jgi:hypothetical protein
VLTVALWLDEVERVEGIDDELRDVNAAWRVAYAMTDGRELSRSERSIRSRMKLLTPADTGPVDGAAHDRTMAKLAKLARIERRTRKGQ